MMLSGQPAIARRIMRRLPLCWRDEGEPPGTFVLKNSFEIGVAIVIVCVAGLPIMSAHQRPAATTNGARGTWPDFRGSNRDGQYTESPIKLRWPRTGLPLLWRRPIGGGYASFVVANNRAFTIEQRGPQEVVTAYDLATGRELWAHGWDEEFREVMGGDGPRATPTYHEGRIYALGARGELRALNAVNGALAWRVNINRDNGTGTLNWGMAASPLVVDDKVIVLPGGPTHGRSVVAYHKLDGTAIWRALNDQQSYTSPMLVTLGGVRQILVVSATRAIGLTVEAGELLWEYPWGNDNAINVAQPIVFTHGRSERVFLSAGYGAGSAVFEVAKANDTFHTRTIWKTQRMSNKFTSSVLRDGYIYGLDESILACVDATTGDVKWKGGRYGYGQVLIAGEHLIVLSELGDVALVRATPQRHMELARFPAIRGKTWNHPVIVDGVLLVRNLREMAAFEIGDTRR